MKQTVERVLPISYQRHKPCGFCCHIKCYDDESYSQKPVIYREKSEEEDVSQIFGENF